MRARTLPGRARTRCARCFRERAPSAGASGPIPEWSSRAPRRGSRGGLSCQRPGRAGGVRLGELQVFYPEASSPSEEEERYLALGARALSAGLHQAKLLTNLRALSAGLDETARERTEQATRAERLVAVGTLAQGVVA